MFLVWSEAGAAAGAGEEGQAACVVLPTCWGCRSALPALRGCQGGVAVVATASQGSLLRTDAGFCSQTQEVHFRESMVE